MPDNADRNSSISDLEKTIKTIRDRLGRVEVVVYGAESESHEKRIGKLESEIEIGRSKYVHNSDFMRINHGTENAISDLRRDWRASIEDIKGSLKSLQKDFVNSLKELKADLLKRIEDGKASTAQIVTWIVSIVIGIPSIITVIVLLVRFANELSRLKP